MNNNIYRIFFYLIILMLIFAKIFFLVLSKTFLIQFNTIESEEKIVNALMLDRNVASELSVIVSND